MVPCSSSHTTPWLWGPVLVLALGGAGGCEAYPTVKQLPLDCTVEDGYEIQMVDRFETVGAAPLWTTGDETFGSNVSVEVGGISDGTRCDSMAALVIHSLHNNDWGSLFGFNTFGPRDASAYEGMSFWARAPGNTTKTFTMLLNDPNTSENSAGPTNCMVYDSTDGGTAQPMGTTVDPNGNVISGTSNVAPPADACGNGYTTAVVVTTAWRFYTVPFSQFKQAPTPNRVPNASLPLTGNVPGNGLLTNSLLSLVLRMPKGAVMDLWIDNLGLYRKAETTVSADGGLDAAAGGG